MIFSPFAIACLICAAGPRVILQHARSIASILWTTDAFIATCITSICRPCNDRKPSDADAGSFSSPGIRG
jgi:hypothetical protein